MLYTGISIYKHKTLSDGRHPIILQVSSNKKRKRITLGYYAFENEWVSEKARFKNSAENAEVKNTALRRFELLAEKIIDESILSGKPISLIEFKRKLLGNQTINANFFEFGKELMDEMKQSGKIGNKAVYNNVINSLKGFTEGQLFFEDIDVSFLSKWEAWLLGDKHDRKGVAKSTANQYMRTTCSIFNKAISRDIVAHELYPFRNQFNPKGYSYAHLKSEAHHRAFSVEELELFKKFDIEKHIKLADSHNYFMFMYYARGMNWTDLCNLRPSNIQNGRLVYKRQKTGKLFTIKISTYMQDLLDKNNPGKYIFSILSDFHKTPLQKANRIKKCIKKINTDLKEIAIRLGIEPNISTYTARHTYAMSLKRGGIRLGIISDAMGHADSKVTRHYLSSFEDDQIDESDAVL